MPLRAAEERLPEGAGSRGFSRETPAVFCGMESARVQKGGCAGADGYFADNLAGIYK